MEQQLADPHPHELASKIGMCLFSYTELLLFAGLLLMYSVYRYRNSHAFHQAAEELDTFIGTFNTLILLVSSMTVAMSITAMQKGQKKHTLILLGITLFLAFVFLVNKYFEWGAKFSHGLYPGSDFLADLGHGDVLFFGLYFFMTGLHALHIIVGIIILGVIYFKVKNEKVHQTDYVLLENGALYWHLVDLIWIFLFPLFYLIT